MARFVAIDRNTGRVYGDTAQFGAAGNVVSPADAVFLFDRKAGRAKRSFGYVRAQSPSACYDVYEIAQGGSAKPASSEADTKAMVDRHGSLVTALVTFNS